MTDFDKYKHLYYGDFDTSYTNFTTNLDTKSYNNNNNNIAREQNNKIWNKRISVDLF
ncbi:hypothetical protein BNCALIDO_00009 [Aeromonas phage vB_AdhM_TS9]|nr:hypothetical protein BNCALIDO_00009 [Aeromonas phage vB_AdhM_TS9]